MLNATFIGIFIRARQRLHSRFHKLFALLAVTDIITGIVISPLHIIQTITDNLQTDHTFDNIRIYMSASLTSLDFYLLTLLAHERYFAVFCKHSGRYTPQARLSLKMLACFFLALAIPTLRLLPHTASIKLDRIATLSAGIIVVFAIIIIYLRIVLKYLKVSMSTLNDADRTMFRKIGLLVITHFLILMPFLVYYSLAFSNKYNCIMLAKLYAIAIPILSSSGIAHPLLYSFNHPLTIEAMEFMITHIDEHHQTYV